MQTNTLNILSTTVTLPETGADIGEFISISITGMAAVVAVAVGGYFAFLLIRKGMKWANHALGFSEDARAYQEYLRDNERFSDDMEERRRESSRDFS